MSFTGPSPLHKWYCYHQSTVTDGLSRISLKDAERPKCSLSTRPPLGLVLTSFSSSCPWQLYWNCNCQNSARWVFYSYSSSGYCELCCSYRARANANRFLALVLGRFSASTTGLSSNAAMISHGTSCRSGYYRKTSPMILSMPGPLTIAR